MWPFKKRKPYIKIGGQRVEIPPLSLPAAIELSLLMAPYWPIIDEHIPRIERALVDKNRDLLSQIFFVLRDRMGDIPGDMTKAVALLAGVDPLWLAQTATAVEIIEALPRLNEAHDLKKLWQTVRMARIYLEPARQ